jgi:cytidine deaminase
MVGRDSSTAATVTKTQSIMANANLDIFHPDIRVCAEQYAVADDISTQYNTHDATLHFLYKQHATF